MSKPSGNFKTASKLVKGALGCCVVGLLLFVLAFSTSSWTTTNFQGLSNNFGLWSFSFCSCITDSCTTQSYKDVSAFHMTIQAMECLGLIFFVAAGILLLVHTLSDDKKSAYSSLHATIGISFLGVFFASAGIAMFMNEDPDWNKYVGDVGWSMVVSIVGTALYGVAGIMLCIERFIPCA